MGAPVEAGRPEDLIHSVAGPMMAAGTGRMNWQGETAPPDYASQSQAARKTLSASGNGAGGTPPAGTRSVP
ncbi:hypothetical protein CIW48_03645 [Methylobacterium sp. P1-11]|nr:hypothetical protein CIW48_03645 [Methylobacterium sp. P1-11]